MANCLQEVRVEKRDDYHVAPLRAKTSLLGFSLLRRSRNELHRANIKKCAFKKITFPDGWYNKKIDLICQELFENILNN
jgi:hypothetical protein